MRSLRLIRNKIDFLLRQKFGFSRTGYFEMPQDKSNLFSVEIEAKADDLLKKYDCQYLKEDTTKINYLENLYLLDTLDKFLEVDFRQDLKVLEVGCKNWSVAKAQYHFFKKRCKNLSLTGIELDANRLYYNLYSRKEAAKFHSKNLDNTRYIAGDFLEHEEKYDYIIWVLPFVFKEPLISWGLPIEYFTPKKMLKHGLNSLNSDGKIFIVNQGAEEYAKQKELYTLNHVAFTDIGEIENDFFQYKIKRFLTIVTP